VGTKRRNREIDLGVYLFVNCEGQQKKISRMHAPLKRVQTLSKKIG